MKTPHPYKIFSLIIFLFLSFNLNAANELEIINLNHRPASEIIPIIKPLLDKTGSISGEKHVLFIRTSAKNFLQLKSAIRLLDADLRQLQISIMQETVSTMKRYGYRVNKDNRTTSAKIFSTQRATRNPRQQVIQVTEGQWATLQTGISVPSISRTKNSNGTITESVQYQTVVTRLKIQPAIIGEKVNIKIKSSTGVNNSTTMQASKSRGLNTHVTGKIGEWIALGGITSTVNNNDSGFIFSTNRASDSMQQIFIKIEITSYQD